jgi:4-amino-4-deoxy-L-arabinose transferase-like glycosyltransferase
MTEPLYLMAYSAFAAVFVKAVTARKGLAWWSLAGVLLGLVVLVKPSAAVLVPLSGVAILAAAYVRSEPLRPALLSVLCLAAAASVIVGAWIARSEALFGTASLADPVYLEASLSHRLAYDRMSWTEWLGGWLYFLPDFGDDAAAALFGKTTLNALGFGSDGYYHYGYYVLHPKAHALTAPALATGYLVKTYMLGDPV